MALPSTIVVNNGAGTPVAYTLSLMSRDANNVAWYRQITPAPPNTIEILYLSVSVTRAKMANRYNPMKAMEDHHVFRYSFYLGKAVTLGTNDAGITPPPQEDLRIVTDCKVSFPTRAVKNDTRDLRAFTANLMLSTAGIDWIDNQLGIG